MEPSFDERSIHLGTCGAGRVRDRRPTSLLTSWLTQRTQARAQELTRHRRRREELYRTFIEQASQLYINALVHDEVQASSKPPTWSKSTP